MSTEHYCRIVMNRETQRLVEALNPASLDAAEISGNLWKQRPFRSYRNFWYPKHDICEGFDAGPFDLVIAEQVWEHLTRPYRAAMNVRRLLRPGGWFLISVPFLIKWHGAPIDCTRWTKEGLRNFLIEAGFDEGSIISDDWGNRDCVEANFDEWVDFEPAKHSLEHDPYYPIVAWALARTPVN